MKRPRLKPGEREHLLRLRAEIGKVRCWLTGFHAGRQAPGQLPVGVPGEDSLRQAQMLLEEMCRE